VELRQRQPRERNEGYLRWLRQQFCSCGCGYPPPCDAAHIRSGSILYGKSYTGMGEKPSDRWAVPLNHTHHMAQHAHGDEIGWWSAQGIDPFALAIKLYKKYTDQNPKTSNRLNITKRRKNKLSKIKSAGFRKDGPKRKINSRGFRV